METRAMPYHSQDQTFARLSKLLTDEMFATGAKSVAATVRSSGGPPQLLAASAGTSVFFVELCLALAEAPQSDGVRELEFGGLGHIMWHASPKLAPAEREVMLFALHDQGRLARGTALVDRLWRSCERALN